MAAWRLIGKKARRAWVGVEDGVGGADVFVQETLLRSMTTIDEQIYIEGKEIPQ
jgi:hypothetical protein